MLVLNETLHDSSPMYQDFGVAIASFNGRGFEHLRERFRNENTGYDIELVNLYGPSRRTEALTDSPGIFLGHRENY